MKRPVILSKPFFPEIEENRMAHVGDVVSARENFLKNKPSNLAFLLEKRYGWMNDFIKEDEAGIEIGCGTGLSKNYIKSKNLVLTDLSDYYWVEKKVDALNMPYPDSSLDFIISSNMIHHLAQPYKFFNECSRVLKNGGRLIIQEINASLIMRFLLKIMKHEGYSFDVDVFDKDSICNDPSDLWSANCAIPNLLFDEIKKFESHFLDFKMIYHKYTECIIFPLSGGVIAKRKTINLPWNILKIIDVTDDILIKISKKIFPLQRRLVLKHIKAERI